MKNGNFEIRDSRNKGFYIMDNEYLNGYARLCGWKATLAYDSLCRHANIRNQEAFPSINTMAKELAVARNTIIAGIKALVEWNIITIKETRGRNNVYVLLDKTVWKSKPNQSTTGTSSPHEPVADMDGGSSPQGLHQFTTRTPTILINKTNKQDGEQLKKLREKIGNLKEKK